jgi:hypothetical protein
VHVVPSIVAFSTIKEGTRRDSDQVKAGRDGRLNPRSRLQHRAKLLGVQACRFEQLPFWREGTNKHREIRLKTLRKRASKRKPAPGVQMPHLIILLIGPNILAINVHAISQPHFRR